MNEDIYKRLVSALQLIALPFEEQMRVLPPFVNQPDEIALIFDDVFRLFVSWELNFSMARGALLQIEELQECLDGMSSDKELWTTEALKNSVEWVECRKLAKSALDELRESIQTPDLGFVRFIEG